MNPRLKPLEALALAIILVAAAQLQASAQEQPGGSFENALRVSLIPGEQAIPEQGYYRLNETSAAHYFLLDGVEGGYRLEIRIEVRGVEQGRTAVALYTEGGEPIIQRKILYGYGTSETIELAYQPSRESAEPGSAHYLSLIRYSGAAEYRLILSLESVEDYAAGEGDAGSSPEAAITLPSLEPGETVRASGHLASRLDGGRYADRVDCYKLRVVYGGGRDALKILLKPSHGLPISATLFQGDFRLKHNESRRPGEPATITLRGDWKPGQEYSYILRIDNLGGRAGGSYEFEAWIEPGNETQPPTPGPGSQGGLQASELRLLVVVGAAALIAISIAMLILRRRRIYRVEEVGWWGEAY